MKVKGAKRGQFLDYNIPSATHDHVRKKQDRAATVIRVGETRTGLLRYQQMVNTKKDQKQQGQRLKGDTFRVRDTLVLQCDNSFTVRFNWTLNDIPAPSTLILTKWFLWNQEASHIFVSVSCFSFGIPFLTTIIRRHHNKKTVVWKSALKQYKIGWTTFKAALLLFKHKLYEIMFLASQYQCYTTVQYK